MIEEYISRLQEENREKLSSYDKEMQDLTQELSVSEKLLSQLEKEKQDDKNIFSPRAIDSGADLEIQKAQDQIRLLKERLEYVSQMVEAESKNREEYQKLAEEAAKEQAGKDHTGEDTAQKDLLPEQAASETELRDETQNNQELVDFLNSLCKKIEFSVSLVNGNKNRCRSELKNLERMIRSYEDGLQKEENS